ncbi:MAG: hypothetical protein ACOX6W_17235 [Lentisphaeria bacterium]
MIRDRDVSQKHLWLMRVLVLSFHPLAAASRRFFVQSSFFQEMQDECCHSTQ